MQIFPTTFKYGSVLPDFNRKYMIEVASLSARDGSKWDQSDKLAIGPVSGLVSIPASRHMALHPQICYLWKTTSTIEREMSQEVRLPCNMLLLEALKYCLKQSFYW